MGEKSKNHGAKSNTPDNEGIDDDLFMYFSDYYYALKNEFYHRLSEKRQIVLTIMSFCLVAEMTFMGAAIGSNSSAVSLAGKCLFAASLALWFISFICALTQTNKIGRFFCALTEEEGMPCVTTGSDVNAFVASGGLRRKKIQKEKPDDADRFWEYAYSGNSTEFFLRKSLHRLHAKECDYDLADMSVKERNRYLRERLLEETASMVVCPNFNRNAWLAKQSRAFGRARIRERRVRVFYRLIYALFALNIVVFLIGVAAVLFGF